MAPERELGAEEESMAHGDTRGAFLNGRARYTAIGTVVAALLVVFSLFAGVPWASKSDREFLQKQIDATKAAADAIKTDIRNELAEMKTDIREIRDELRRQRRGGGP